MYIGLASVRTVFQYEPCRSGDVYLLVMVVVVERTAPAAAVRLTAAHDVIPTPASTPDFGTTTVCICSSVTVIWCAQNLESFWEAYRARNQHSAHPHSSHPALVVTYLDRRAKHRTFIHTTRKTRNIVTRHSGEALKRRNQICLQRLPQERL